jgi:2'-5' RNA ligase
MVIALPANQTEPGKNDHGETARLFIALWPEAAFSSALHAQCGVCTTDLHARVVTPERVHMTLHFLGPVPRQQLPALVSALRVPFQPFEFNFSRCEQWPHGLLVAVPDTVPPPLVQLRGALGEVLQGLGLPVDERAFRPHLTLARRHAGPCPVMKNPPLGWRVTAYLLVESQGAPAGAYRAVQSFK